MFHKFKIYMIHYKITVNEMLEILLAISRLKRFYENMYKEQPTYKTLLLINKCKNMWDELYKKTEYES